jgi:hypothetical protein
VIGEFVCCSFCGYASTLVEGFVEDADSFEGLTVCTGGCAGALMLLDWFRSRDRCILLHTFLFDFLQARQAVETLFFHVPLPSGGLPFSSCS